ncbi:MAG: aconitate hydratase [Dehalococcoidia bacterium]
MAERINPFGSRATLAAADGAMTVGYYQLDSIEREGGVSVSRLPMTVKILVENLLRQVDGEIVTEADVVRLARCDESSAGQEFPYLPYRVVLQDFTGVPCVVDLAAMRSAVARLGGDPQRINPLSPADLVIDHSVQVDQFGTVGAFAANVDLEYERNRERYALLRWAQGALQNFRVVPPGTGIVHQVNLEYLASVVATRTEGNETIAFPDTLVGTDSHTTMVNGLGVLGWGVGGIEAEAVLLGQPMYQLAPIVVGVTLSGQLPEGATATDLVLTVTEMLRGHGVVNKFVEFAGAGLSNLGLADRATISNMAPEYGATAALFPVDEETLRYMRLTGRDEQLVDLVERYCRAQGLFRTDDMPLPRFDEELTLDLGTIQPSLAGPRRPQDRVLLGDVRRVFRSSYPEHYTPKEESTEEDDVPASSSAQAGGEDVPRFDYEGGTVNEEEEPSEIISPEDLEPQRIEIAMDGERTDVGHGSVVIAAITSCTNTSNPMVMVGAGILAKKAVERGLSVKPYVKTSLAPGSRAVSDYLQDAGLLPYLEALRFHVVGYGCTTCIGNSGPLPEPVAEAVQEHGLVVASVLSGNRNFEGRIHPQVRASFLASPPLVVAYALAGSVDKDLTRQPLGEDPNGQPVYLHDIWPTQEEIRSAIGEAVTPELFRKTYEVVFAGDDLWRSMPVPEGALYQWDEDSTYIQEPPFFQNMSTEPGQVSDIAGARVLVSVGDSVTTDHISPAGSIPRESPAGKYLLQHEVAPHDFNSYGARRGNHEVMMRGTFGNIRLRNILAEGKEGYWSQYVPTGEIMPIFDASMKYQAEGTPLLVLAGKEYGTGSSRDWAAKGPLLLGVHAAIAESYERIHRSNLVGMGILPLEYLPGESAVTLGLTGKETFDITGIADGLGPRTRATVRVRREDGSAFDFQTIVRIDSRMEVEYYRHGGILQYVLRRLLRETV